MTKPHITTRRRIWQDGDSVVLRDHDDYENCDYERWFWVPPNGGYIREISEDRPGTLGEQVCGYLEHGGWTLTASRDNLLDVIRREYAARERKARRDRQW